MRVKNFLIGLTISLSGVSTLIGCASSIGTAPLAIQTVAPSTVVVTPTRAPTALPTTAPTKIPPTAVPTANALATTAAAAGTQVVDYVTALDGGKEPFDKPAAIAQDSDGNLYVLEGSNQILKYDSAGEFLLKWGSSGSGGWSV